MNNSPSQPIVAEPHWVSRSAFQIIIFAILFAEISLGLLINANATLWIIVPLTLVLSHLMHGAAVGLHEATHGLLRKNRRFNEVDGVLLGVFSFMSFSLYRAAHQSHHAYFATERDEELWPFVMTTKPRWVRRLAAFCELTFGLIYTPYLFLRTFLRKGSPIRSAKVRRRIWKELLLMVAVWTSVIVAVSIWQVWTYFLWMYLVPAFIAGNLQSWRKYIEHVGLMGRTTNGSTRNIIADGWPGKLVAFTLLHEPFHGVHHLHVGLPHSKLPFYASELEPRTDDEPHPFPNYRHAIGHLLRQLADPRVGAQWRRAQP